MIDDAGLFACDRCGAPRQLLVRLITDELVDGPCWRKAGSPFPLAQAGLAEVAANEARIREAMVRRGGAERHLVRKGV